MVTFSTFRARILRTIPIVLILTFPQLGQSIDMDSAKKGEQCFEIKKTEPLDNAWASSMKVYVPLMSRSELYYAAMEVAGKDPKDIIESDLYYKFCLWGGSINATTFFFEGFGGKRITFRREYKSDGKHRFEYFDDGVIVSTCWITLTDNKTYYVRSCCYNDGQMMWGVDSSVKKLPEETEKKIFEHAASIGFKKEQFTTLCYDNC